MPFFEDLKQALEQENAAEINKLVLGRQNLAEAVKLYTSLGFLNVVVDRKLNEENLVQGPNEFSSEEISYHAFSPALSEHPRTKIKNLTPQEQTELLCLAVTNKQTLLVGMLLDAGCDPDRPNSQGQKPAVLAQQKNQGDIFAMLVEHGANLNEQIEGISLSGHMSVQGHGEQIEALFVETNHLKEDQKNIKTESKAAPDEPRQIAYEKMLQLAKSATLSNRQRIESAIGNFERMDDIIQAILDRADRSTDTFKVSIGNLTHNFPEFLSKYIRPEYKGKLKQVLDLSYLLYAEFPYNNNHGFEGFRRLKLYLEQALANDPDHSLEEAEKKQKEHAKSFETFNEKISAGLSSQSWALKGLEANIDSQNKEVISYDGECAGVGFMSLQAILTNEVDLCKKRIQQISGMPKGKLEQQIKANQKILQRKTIIDRYYQPNLKERRMLEIQAYLQGVAYAQQPEAFPEFRLTKDKRTDQGYLHTSAIIMSYQLEYQGGLAHIKYFTTNYNKGGLVGYFESLRNTIRQNKSMDPFALSLTGDSHRIVVGYLPDKDIWVFSDANAKPVIQKCHSNWLIADKVLKGMTPTAGNPAQKIITEVYSAKNQEKMAAKITKEWLETPEMTYLLGPEEFTYQKFQGRQEYSEENAFSLCLAVASGKLDLVRRALKDKEPISQELLTTSLAQLNPEILKLLLEQAPPLDQKFLFTFLQKITSEGKVDHFKVLMESTRSDITEAVAECNIFYHVHNHPAALNFSDDILQKFDSKKMTYPGKIWGEFVSQLDDLPARLPQWNKYIQNVLLFLGKLKHEQATAIINNKSFQDGMFSQIPQHELYFVAKDPKTELRSLFFNNFLAFLEAGGKAKDKEVLKNLLENLFNYDHQLAFKLLATENPQLKEVLSKLYINYSLDPSIVLYPATQAYLPFWCNSMQTLNYAIGWGETEEAKKIVALKPIQDGLNKVCEEGDLDELLNLYYIAKHLTPEQKAVHLRACFKNLVKEARDENTKCDLVDIYQRLLTNSKSEGLGVITQEFIKHPLFSQLMTKPENLDSLKRRWHNWFKEPFPVVTVLTASLNKKSPLQAQGKFKYVDDVQDKENIAPSNIVSNSSIKPSKS